MRERTGGLGTRRAAEHVVRNAPRLQGLWSTSVGALVPSSLLALEGASVTGKVAKANIATAPATKNIALGKATQWSFIIVHCTHLHPEKHSDWSYEERIEKGLSWM